MAAASPSPSTSPAVEALIFDCDGTLINSMEYFWIGWNALVTKYDYKFSKEQFYSLAGLPVRDIVELVLTQSGCGRGKVRSKDNGEIVIEEKEETEAEFSARVEEFLHEKHEIVKALRAKGRKNGLEKRMLCCMRYRPASRGHGLASWILVCRKK